MEAIPAVDLKGGRCVRLRQGRMDQETVFSPDPVAMALQWQKAGAGRLHVVDLDGAVAGRPANAEAIKAVCAALDIPVQLGGGVRDLSGIERTLELGVDRVILGTLAARDPAAALDAARKLPGRVVMGIDARDGRVAVQGWTEDAGWDYLELAARLNDPAVAAVVFTDISKDGMQKGPNLQSTEALCREIGVPVIAAGGVHEIADVRALKTLEPLGLAGFITGRAIYEGTLDLAEALALAQS